MLALCSMFIFMIMFTVSDARRLGNQPDVNFEQFEGVIYGVATALLFCLTINARLDKNTKVPSKMDDTSFTVVTPYRRPLYVQRL